MVTTTTIVHVLHLHLSQQQNSFRYYIIFFVMLINWLIDWYYNEEVSGTDLCCHLANLMIKYRQESFMTIAVAVSRNVVINKHGCKQMLHRCTHRYKHTGDKNNTLLAVSRTRWQSYKVCNKNANKHRRLKTIRRQLLPYQIKTRIVRLLWA